MNKNDQIKNYYTDDVRTAIREMTFEDMKNSLKSLESSPFWFSILKYTQDRIAVIQDSFLTLDPVKSPTEIARYQGAITGMLDLQDAVLSLKFESKKKDDPEFDKEKNMNDMGGAYGVV